MACDDDDPDRQLDRALAALQNVHVDGLAFEDAVSVLRSELLGDAAPIANPQIGALIPLVGIGFDQRALLQLFRENGILNKWECRLAVRRKLFTVWVDGRLAIHAKSINRRWASSVLGAVVVMIAAWIVWVLRQDEVGLDVIANSYIAGSVLGWLASPWWDFGFGVPRIVARLHAANVPVTVVSDKLNIKRQILGLS